jgi:hypothetical protein
MSRWVVHLTRFAGSVAALWAVAYTVNAATRAGGDVTIRVLSQGRALELDVWGSTVAEQLLSRADVLLAGLCAGAAALALPGVLTHVMRGRPYRKGNAARVGWLGALTGLAALGGPLLTSAGAGGVLDRAGSRGFEPAFALSGGLVAAGWLLLALGLALRAGEKAEMAEAAAAASASVTRPDAP